MARAPARHMPCLQGRVTVAVRKVYTLMKSRSFRCLIALIAAYGCTAHAQASAHTSAGPQHGWLIIDGGGTLINEVKERFVALIGGPDARVVAIPTAMADGEFDSSTYAQHIAQLLGVRHVTVLHTRNRAEADSAAFVRCLDDAAGVWIDGGRQWRLADAYLGTAVERHLKELLERGGVVLGSSAGATIQGSFLVRGAAASPTHPEGDNSIVMASGHEIGFGLLSNSAIDQHIDTRGREHDIDTVLAAHPELLGIGLDESAAIVVHRDAFFVVGGQVLVSDGTKSSGERHLILSPGQAYDLAARQLQPSYQRLRDDFPATLVVKTAVRSQASLGWKTVGTGVLQGPQPGNPSAVQLDCAVSLYSYGSADYPVRVDGPGQISVLTRPVDSDALQGALCRTDLQTGTTPPPGQYFTPDSLLTQLDHDNGQLAELYLVGVYDLTQELGQSCALRGTTNPEMLARIYRGYLTSHPDRMQAHHTAAGVAAEAFAQHWPCAGHATQ
jgi:cyanophycinase